MNHHARPGAECLGDEAVAVGVETPEGDEEVPGTTLPGIIYNVGDEGILSDHAVDACLAQERL